MRINNIEYTNWNDAYRIVKVSGENKFEISISMPRESGKDSVNMLDLCYVFPLADYILGNGKSLEVKLNTASTSDEEKWRAKRRIDALLRAETCRFQHNGNIRFLIDGYPYNSWDDLIRGDPIETNNLYLEASDNTRKLLRGALLIQQKNENGVEKIKILPSRKIEKKADIEIELKALTEKSFKRSKANYKVEIVEREEPSRIAPIISVSMEHEDSSVRLEDLLGYGNKRESSDPLQLKYLQNVCYRLRSYLEDEENYSGSDDIKIKREQKTQLAGQMGSILGKKLPYMTLLSQCIWLYILRDLLESKELFGLVVDADGIEKRCLDIELLEKSHLNAISYAEGLYQIIENACLYSNGKRAYWGMRIYRSSLNGGIEEEMKRAASNHALFEKYKRCTYSTGLDKDGRPTETVVTPTLFSKKYSRLLEFYVIDEAMEGKGLLKTAIREFNKIEDLIEDSPSLRENNWDEFSDDIANHYGLRLFSKIIDRNDGYTVVRSPNGAEKTNTLFRRFQANLHNEDEEGKPSFTTSFHIIVPMIPEEKGEKQMAHGQHSLFGTPRNDRPYWTTCIEIDCTARPEVNDINSKVNRVSAFTEQMASALDGLQKNGRNAILTLDLRKSGLFEAELLAKALFKLSVRQWWGGHPLYVAVLFSANGSEAQEFIRIFASFYDKMSDADKAGKRNPYISEILGNIQIAVCTSDSNKGEVGKAVEVNFVFSGKSPALAYQSAKNYLYNYFSSGLRFLPLLRYFAHEKKESAEKPIETTWFPFDLYLSTQCFENGEKQLCEPWLKSLFLDRMERVLNTDLQEHADGCRIKGVHMRIGSKLHLDTFYEAELLFRSIGNVQEFAYIIANDLLEKLKLMLESSKFDRVILVGYEKYSAELVTQVFTWLKREGWPIIACVIPATGSEQNQCVHIATWGAEKPQEGDIRPKATLLTIIPVGSTMSTIYKVRNIARRHFQNKYKIDEPSENSKDVLDYCIVAVNSQLRLAEEKKVEERGQNGVTWKYWESIDTKNKTILVKREKTNERDLPVRYLLSADATWSEPIGVKDRENACEACEQLKQLHEKDGIMKLPLLQVDKSSMVPETIFLLRNSELRLLGPKSEKEKDDNKKRMEQLKGLIRYGHICENENHFQFYFDLAKLFQNNRENIEDWLESIEIEDSAYNIIIAPNNIDGAPFLCAVMEKVFCNSLRFLHLNINEAYREDVRLKFSQMADEYKLLRQKMPNVPFRVYYMANTISGAKTISRAQLLVEMLLNESGLSRASGKFAKVILLLCRSSYDTMKQFVNDPQKDVAAWLTLNIPPYNMQADRCPACELLGKYELLRKRSSTETIGRMFERLEKKHAKRSREEYDRWLLNAILQDHSYYAGFKEFFFFHSRTDKGRQALRMTKAQANAMQQAFEAEMRKILRGLDLPKKCPSEEDILQPKYLNCLRADENNALRDKFREKLFERTLESLVESYNQVRGENEELSALDLAYLIRDTVVATRNYRRLVCLQEAYQFLIRLQPKAENIDTMNDELDKKTRAEILHIICLHLVWEPKTKETLAENAEWLISFIKVLSRELLVKYYHIHRAIVNIMYDMLAFINYDGLIIEREKELEREDQNWIPILRTLRFIPSENDHTTRSEKAALCASLQYEIFMTLVHRLSVLQCSLVYEKKSIDDAIVGLAKISKKYFAMGEYALPGTEWIKALTYTELPPSGRIRNRYIKSVKTASMLTSNDDPCFRMAQEIGGEQA